MSTTPDTSFGPRHPAWLIATWFGVGKSKFAPGTMGSLAALPFAYLIHNFLGSQWLLMFSIVLFVVGKWASDVYMKHTGSDHDPGEIVIDEVMGQCLLLVAFNTNPLSYLVAFLVFRVFDILKPWPISYFDKTVHGGFGVMFDDFLAAIYPAMIVGFIAILSVLLGKAEWMEFLFVVLG